MSDPFKIDSHKLSYHPTWVANFLEEKASKTPGSTRLGPIYMEVALVGACNHRCTFCAVDYLGYESNRLSVESFNNFCISASANGVKSLMFAGEGEPLLHKEASTFATAAKSNSIDVAWTTNGTIIPADFLEVGIRHSDWIKVSINGGSDSAYNKIHRGRPGDFAKVLKNVRSIVDARNATNSACKIGVQMVLTDENKDTAFDLVGIAQEQLNVDYIVFKPYSRHKFSDHQDIFSSVYWDLSELEAFARVRSTPDFKVIVRAATLKSVSEKPSYSKCYATPYAWGYIMANGDFYSCSAYLGDPRFKLGNINDSSFDKIWTGQVRRKHIDFINNDLDITECRQGCRMHAVNTYLDEIINDKILHKNFI